MKGDAFVDSNVLIYAFDNMAGAKHATAKTLLELLWNTRRGALSVQSVGWVSGSPRNPTFWRRDVGLRRGRLTQPTDWDSLIVASALEADCQSLYSEDMQNGRLIKRRLRIINPFTE